MFVLSASASRSGSRWYFHLTNTVLKLAGKADSFVICEKYKLPFVNANAYLNEIQWYKLLCLSLIALAEDTFAVKTHSGPTRTLRLLSQVAQVKITYIYRDPRDRVLSALEQGARSRENGDNLFSSIHSLEDAIKHIKSSYRILTQWQQLHSVFFVRYEDLVDDPVGVMFNTAQFLNLPIDKARVEQAIALVGERQNTRQVGYYKGGTRYQNGFSNAELDQINEALHQEILGFGYPLN